MAVAEPNKFTIGDVIWLRTGLRGWHWQAQQITTIDKPVTGVITGIRRKKDSTIMIDVKALNSRGEYYKDAARFTFAHAGPFLPEFLMQDIQVLRRLLKYK